MKAILTVLITALVCIFAFFLIPNFGDNVAEAGFVQDYEKQLEKEGKSVYTKEAFEAAVKQTADSIVLAGADASKAVIDSVLLEENKTLKLGRDSFDKRVTLLNVLRIEERRMFTPRDSFENQSPAKGLYSSNGYELIVGEKVMKFRSTADSLSQTYFVDASPEWTDSTKVLIHGTDLRGKKAKILVKFDPKKVGKAKIE